MPLVDAVMTSPKNKKCVKQMVPKTFTEEQSVMMVSVESEIDSDSSGSPLIRRRRSIALGGMDNSGPTAEDLADLDNNERSIVEFGLGMEEREASGQVPEDDPTLDFEPRSERQIVPTETSDAAGNQETLAQKKIDYALADLLPMRWTGTDFDRILIPAIHQRPWTPPAGYACVYESWFLNCSLWWPLPEFLTTNCSRQKIDLGQYTANGIWILVTLTVLAAELGIKMSAHLLEELTTPSITMKTGFFYGKMVPKSNVITGKPTKVNFWNHRYFYIKINESSFEDPSIILNGYFNANIDRLSKWSQGGIQSFLEEVEAIKTLSHQHWSDISEARIQAALNRINRAAFTWPNRSSRMGKLNLASLPSYADTIGTPVHGDGSSGAGRPAKRKRPANVEEETRQASASQSPLTEMPVETIGNDGQEQGPSQEEGLLLSSAIPAAATTFTEVPTEEHLADPQAAETRGEQPTEPGSVAREDVVGYPHVVDFRYQQNSVPFVEDHEAPARLFRQIQLKRRGMPELEQLSQSYRYQEMTRAGAMFFGSADLMVRDYEAKLKAQDEKIALKIGALKRKRKEIAELAYKCGSYKEQIGTLTAEKNEAVEHAELERSRNEALLKELEELKALKEGLDTQCHNLEQENSKIVLRFETTTRRLRESREHEVKGIRESLEKIHSQGLSMEEILQKARADKLKYQGELQGMEVIEASKIDLTPIGVDKHGSNMAVFSPKTSRISVLNRIVTI
ncbi:hypothetical protein N665_0123s0008 [Sinapis alba]|nr:hypothetical protein N665_0123s0008 [Sinapis alba]